mmetsp:Transcript_106967/g.297882  ORF Transcript_106967/g.297882 Transcript_106967/m.297882 type:complete len:206 (-) Transcript_106967:857-1474(-)
MLAVVLVLSTQKFWSSILPQAVCHLHPFVVEPALHLPWDATQHARPCGSFEPRLLRLHAPRRHIAATSNLAACQLVGVRYRDGNVVHDLLGPGGLLALQAPHHRDHTALEELRDYGGKVRRWGRVLVPLLVLVGSASRNWLRGGAGAALRGCTGAAGARHPEFLGGPLRHRPLALCLQRLVARGRGARARRVGARPGQRRRGLRG